MLEKHSKQRSRNREGDRPKSCADFPLEMLVTVAFEEYEGKTKLTLHHVGIPSGADHDGAQQGWNESFDKLAEHLAKV